MAIYFICSQIMAKNFYKSSFSFYFLIWYFLCIYLNILFGRNFIKILNIERFLLKCRNYEIDFISEKTEKICNCDPQTLSSFIFQIINLLFFKNLHLIHHRLRNSDVLKIYEYTIQGDVKFHRLDSFKISNSRDQFFRH